MSSQTKVFLTGATGYIGGSVLFRLLKDPNARQYEFTAFVRSPEKAAKLNAFGVRTIIGSYSDLDKLTQAASEADVVVEMADSDNDVAMAAVLSGMKLHYQATGAVPILVHTSGTGVFLDDAQGQHGDHTIYDDLNVQQIASLAPEALHRNVDLLIEAADAEGYIKSYINLPGLIWGIADNDLTKAGVQNPFSVQIPTLVRASIQSKRGGMVGKGGNVWVGLSNDDVTDFIVLLFNKALYDPKTAHGHEGYYIVESVEFPLKVVAEGIAEALVHFGITTDSEPYSFTPEENVKYFGTFWHALSANSRGRGNRSRALGWKPIHGLQDMLATFRPEVEVQLKKLEFIA